jgi:hypothetical protein
MLQIINFNIINILMFLIMVVIIIRYYSLKCSDDDILKKINELTLVY